MKKLKYTTSAIALSLILTNNVMAGDDTIIGATDEQSNQNLTSSLTGGSAISNGVNNIVNFAASSYALTQENVTLLSNIAYSLNDGENVKIYLTGYAQDDSSEGLNPALAERRARAIMEYLSMVDSASLDKFVGENETVTSAGLFADNTSYYHASILAYGDAISTGNTLTSDTNTFNLAAGNKNYVSGGTAILSPDTLAKTSGGNNIHSFNFINATSSAVASGNRLIAKDNDITFGAGNNNAIAGGYTTGTSQATMTVNFEDGKYNITPTYANLLDEASGKLHDRLEIEDDGPANNIFVIGNQTGSITSTLSENRTRAVDSYLVSRGVNADEIETEISDQLFSASDVGSENSVFVGIFNSFTSSDNNLVLENTTSTFGTGDYNAIAGGYAYADIGIVTANNNNLTIIGGSHNVETVAGGYAKYSIIGKAETMNNTVTLVSGATFSSMTELLGGTGDINKGNTLNLVNYTGTTRFSNIANFEFYNFHLGSNVMSGDTIIQTTNIDFTGANINSVSFDSGSMLGVNDTINLISFDNATGTIAQDGGIASSAIGLSKIIEWEINQTASDLTATIKNITGNQQTKALAEGIIGGVGFLNQGADVMMSTGLQAVETALANSELNIAPFFGMSGGSYKYNTGSYAEVDGFSLLAGLGYDKEIDDKDLTIAVFIESGNGSYDTYNSFSGASDINGSGDNSYIGAGVMGTFEGLGQDKNTYIEASLRFGKNDTDFSSYDFIGFNNVSYDVDAIYYGFHFGAGKVHTIDENSELDVYGKFLLTHQQSSDAIIHGDKVEFSSINSHRFRAGARYHQDIYYGGLAYEYEANGKADMKISGLSTDAPSLKGGTGILELGVSVENIKETGLDINIGLNGYIGTREGFSGSAQAIYKF